MLPAFPWLVYVGRLYAFRTAGGTLQPIWAFLIVRHEVQRQGRGWSQLALDLLYGGQPDDRDQVMRLVYLDAAVLVAMTTFWVDWVVPPWRGLPAAYALDLMALTRFLLWVALYFWRR